MQSLYDPSCFLTIMTSAKKGLLLHVIIPTSNSSCTKLSIFDLYLWDYLYEFFLIGVDPRIISMMWSLEYGGGKPWEGFWKMSLCSPRSCYNSCGLVFCLSLAVLSIAYPCKKKAWSPLFNHLFHFIGWDNLGRGN